MGAIDESGAAKIGTGERKGGGRPRASGGEVGIRCDFCHAVVPSVRRVALDRDYERLRTPHQLQYACSSCSEKKEQERLGLTRSRASAVDRSKAIL